MEGSHRIRTRDRLVFWGIIFAVTALLLSGCDGVGIDPDEADPFVAPDLSGWWWAREIDFGAGGGGLFHDVLFIVEESGDGYSFESLVFVRTGGSSALEQLDGYSTRGTFVVHETTIAYSIAERYAFDADSDQIWWHTVADSASRAYEYDGDVLEAAIPSASQIVAAFSRAPDTELDTRLSAVDQWEYWAQDQSHEALGFDADGTFSWSISAGDGSVLEGAWTTLPADDEPFDGYLLLRIAESDGKAYEVERLIPYEYRHEDDGLRLDLWRHWDDEVTVFRWWFAMA